MRRSAGRGGWRGGRRAARGAATATAVALALAVLSGLVPVVVVGPTPAGAAGAAGAVRLRDLAALVDPMVGTGTVDVQPGDVDTFPGASMPFGMIQWSPDTSPNRRDGGGYDYHDHRILGFSLTHLSGPGCPYFGDVPILPTTGAVPADPEAATEPFSHRDEHAAPGSYSVGLGAGPARTAVSMAVTDRTGTGRVVFPAGGSGSGNLLFKAGDSAAGSSASTLSFRGDDEVVGSVTGTAFCDTSQPYTLYFVARFDRPFAGHGTWEGRADRAGASSCTGTSTRSCGGWVSFGTRARRTVGIQVAISYVSVDGALANLRAEDPGWRVGVLAARAAAAWSSMLGRIQVGGGSATRRRTFYTALYHSLLSPNVVSDAGGQYPGFEHTVQATTHQAHYTNFSEWDIYRTQFPLVAMLFPRRASAMVQSLVDDAAQTGWLPRWPVVASDAGQTDGDSADLLVAEAYAFGARDFDASSALADMVKGATQQEGGFVQERQNLTTYLQLGYVPGDTEDLTSYGYTLGTSVTLEYALDDFGISQLAAALGDAPVAATMRRQSQKWQNVFDPSTGYMAARTASGAFVAGPAFQPTHVEGQGQVGFEEGNAVQYSWGVPQDLASLFSLMGGDAAATAKLDEFFTHLDASRYHPYYWAGNEPDLWAPWEYDFSGAPWRTQQVVRRVLDTQYGLDPDGEPGNDDLGALAAWYVWGSIGLYPVTPGTATLAVATPAFASVTVHLGGGHLGSGHVLRITTSGPTDGYVHAARLAVGGGASRAWDRVWLPASASAAGATLRLEASSAPDRSWAAAPKDAPPSYGTDAAPAVGFTTPGGAVATSPGGTPHFRLGVQAAAHGAVTVDWTAQPPAGMTVTPASGQLVLRATAAGAATARASVPVTVSGAATGDTAVPFTLTTSGGTALPSLVLEVDSR